MVNKIKTTIKIIIHKIKIKIAIKHQIDNRTSVKKQKDEDDEKKKNGNL